MKAESYWQKVRWRRFPSLRKPLEFDVVVIGGGITGVTTAYLLKQAGKRVCLLERERLGHGDTGVTTAHLTAVPDLRISALAKTFGEEAGGLVLQAGNAAIDLIEQIVMDEAIECDFRRVPGYLFAHHDNEQERERLHRDAELAQRLGLPAKFLESVPYFENPGIQFADQAKFHPLKYVVALAQRVDGDGSAVFEHSEVSDVQESLSVIVNGQEVKCAFVVIATHVPLTGKTGLLKATLFQSKIYPYSTYAVGATVAKGTVPEACYWDTSDPYHFLRVESGKSQDYLIFGGQDHKTGQVADTVERFAGLTHALRALVPHAQPDRQWSGQVIETNDGLPFIGETSPGQFIATGFSGNGMTFGTVAAQMACDAAFQRTSPWQKLFAVDRAKVLGGAWDYLVENADYPYHFIKDRLVATNRGSTDQLKCGAGMILDVDGTRAACSRDSDGELHTVSAYCTHMGCLVRWNNGEQTWDCPCHGSRFQPDGKVLAGPAESNLEPIDGVPNVQLRSTSQSHAVAKN